ncbi:MAG: adenosine deaminase [Terriglobia bacterium]
MSEIFSPLESFIHRLPKAELHLHLEGSIEPETLRELTRIKGRLQQEAESCIRDQESCRFRYGSHQEFLRRFKLVSLLLESPDDYALATSKLAERLAQQNVRYAEVTLSAGVILWKKQPLGEIFKAILEATRDSEARLPLRIQWIFDAVRQFGAEHAREVLQETRPFLNGDVVAFGIGGDERAGPPEIFEGVYREARELGLRLTAHAGETAGPESIRKSVEILSAERIGHGLTAARDQKLMELLRERGIALEVCLTSNVSTGLISEPGNHPLRSFVESGVTVTLNSDDPAMFGTSLERELLIAAMTFSLSHAELRGICRNAIQVAFIAGGDKQRLLAEFDGAGV